MNSSASGSRLLLLSLDGLSLSQLDELSQLSSDFRQFLVRISDRKELACPLSTSPQAAWSELLTGLSWSQLGCPGYARPKDSLNDLEIVTEDLLSGRLDLLECPGAERQLLINLPIVKPKDGRIWLSDGSWPYQNTVSPIELRNCHPFDAYRPRPYASTTVALSDRRSSIISCLAAERQRLECALELIRNQRWRICIYRVSVFDQLAHLIGSDSLFCQGLIESKELEEFWTSLGTGLSEIAELCADTTLAVISTFSHVNCRARLNLNELLSLAGFCVLRKTENAEMTSIIERRRSAALALAKAEVAVESAAAQQPAVSSTSCFELERTVAGSPTAGAVYLNRKSRFASGIVEDFQVNVILERVEDYLRNYLTKEFASGFQLEKIIGGHERSPDLIVQINGVELHNTLGPPWLDRHNHPRSTHCGAGFIALSASLSSLSAPTSPLQLYKLLKEVVA
jgi:hypothetical protein